MRAALLLIVALGAATVAGGPAAAQNAAGDRDLVARYLASQGRHADLREMGPTRLRRLAESARRWEAGFDDGRVVPEARRARIGAALLRRGVALPLPALSATEAETLEWMLREGAPRAALRSVVSRLP